MKKCITSVLFASFGVMILGGCTGEPILSNKDAETSKAYTHKSTTINVPYSKAVRNFLKGLNMCAENVSTPSLVVVGTGAVRMPGDDYYHVVMNRRGKFEYNLRFFMGGVIEGSCALCQPKGGYYSIYSTLQKTSATKTKLKTHTYSKFNNEVAAIEKWVKGDLSSCHEFMGKD